MVALVLEHWLTGWEEITNMFRSFELRLSFRAVLRLVFPLAPDIADLQWCWGTKPFFSGWGQQGTLFCGKCAAAHTPIVLTVLIIRVRPTLLTLVNDFVFNLFSTFIMMIYGWDVMFRDINLLVNAGGNLSHLWFVLSWCETYSKVHDELVLREADSEVFITQWDSLRWCQLSLQKQLECWVCIVTWSGAYVWYLME